MSTIVFEQITKRYGASADAPLVVQGISFEVPQGTLTTILGPSGCGKTTTLRMIAGLESPTSGRISIGGCDVTTLGPAQRNVSMMFQSYALFPHMSVLQNVMYGLRMSGVDKAAAQTRAQQALRSVGLVDLDERSPGELSGGQQQRVALARALVLEPAVLLFDEPLSNLDARLRREMREEIRTLQQRLGLTVAYVTHDQNEALAVSDHIIVMNQGRIAQHGTPRQLYEAPQSEFVAGFMGEATLWDAQQGASGQVNLGPLVIAAVATGSSAQQPRTQAGPVKVAVRPQAWRIGASGSGLPATLARAAYLGSHYEYHFDSALGPVFVISHDLSQHLAPGAQVGLSLGAQGVSVLHADAPALA